jgi:uncharacterized protein YcgL (UPF0745 family)
MKDLKGFTFTVGDEVARPVLLGKSPHIEFCRVTRIQDGKLYLDDSKQAMRFPERLLITEGEPVLRMMQKYEMNKAERDDSGA